MDYGRYVICYTPKGVIMVVLRIIEIIHAFPIGKVDMACIFLKLCICLLVFVVKCSTFIVLKKLKSYY